MRDWELRPGLDDTRGRPQTFSLMRRGHFLVVRAVSLLPVLDKIVRGIRVYNFFPFPNNLPLWQDLSKLHLDFDTSVACSLHLTVYFIVYSYLFCIFLAYRKYFYLALAFCKIITVSCLSIQIQIWRNSTTRL